MSELGPIRLPKSGYYFVPKYIIVRQMEYALRRKTLYNSTINIEYDYIR